MKFVSKNSNLMVVLRSGISENRISGQAQIPGLYVNFRGGVAEVKDQQMLDMLLSHPSYGTDFISVEEDSRDPYEKERKDNEPKHQISEVEYGHIGKSYGSKLKDPREEIIEKAMELIPSIIEKLVEKGEISINKKEATEQVDSKETADESSDLEEVVDNESEELHFEDLIVDEN